MIEGLDTLLTVKGRDGMLTCMETLVRRYITDIRSLYGVMLWQWQKHLSFRLQNAFKEWQNIPHPVNITLHNTDDP